MTIFNENQFTNPQIFAGRPPDAPPCDPACREMLKGFWYTKHGCMPITKTDCSDLKTRATNDDRMGVYLVKQISPYNPTGESSGSSNKNYDPSLQFGMHNFGRKLEWMKSGILISGGSETPYGGFITTPYHSRDRSNDRNGVNGRTDNIDEGSLVYRWDMMNDDVKRAQAVEDGSIAFNTEGRDESRKFRLTLEVVKWEKKRRDEAEGVNTCVNAFTLVLGIQPGGEVNLPVKYQNTQTPSQSQPNPEGKSSVTEHEPWVVTIKFGDVTAQIMETRSEVMIEFATSGGSDPIRRQVTLNPTASSKTSSHAGPQPYHFTFIPVWNGVLFSDSEPQTDSWPDRIVYIPKNTKRNVASVVHEQMEENANEKPPRWGKDGENLPQGEAGNCQQVGTDVDSLIILPDSDDLTVKFGEKIDVFYERCGGSLKFKPVYFTNCFQTHLLLQAEGGCADNEGACDGNPFDADRLEQHFVTPVVHYSSEKGCIDEFSIRSGIYSLGQGQDKPLATLSTEACRCTRAFRRPLQIWGHLLYAVEKAGGNGRGIFRAGEGALRNQDLPIVRAQSLSVNRSLDGTQGSIKWDRFNPGGGLINRPSQHVGAVRLVVQGGVNTQGGVVFTGIAMGNAVLNNPSANEVELPLRGREVKMTDADGGLRLINAPFFDGYDHREVFEYLCCYAGIPCKVFAGPYKLPSNTNILAEPVVNFKTGTPVWDAISELQKLAGTLAYFDRFGVLNYRDVNTTTGVNWNLPDAKVESYDDKPDLGQMRDTVVIAALVSTGEVDQEFIFNGDFNKRPPRTSPSLVTLRIPTIPAFPWSKMMFYVIPSILKPADLKKMAAQIAKGVSRPRAAGSVVIPGNANIDLLDTVNENWVITGITQSADINGKRFGTTLNLELLAEGGGGAIVNACKPNGGNDGPGGGDEQPPIGSEYDDDGGLPKL